MSEELARVLYVVIRAGDVVGVVVFEYVADSVFSLGCGRSGFFVVGLGVDVVLVTEFFSWRTINCFIYDKKREVI